MSIDLSGEFEMPRNRARYQAGAGTYWARREHLLPDEQALIEAYLDKDRTTVEAGTGGGRILREMQGLGFTSLHGFDFVPELIAQAKANDQSGSIHFEVQDATRLTYPDASFQQAIYLQQLLSLIETVTDRLAAARKAYRILEPGGTALFSILCFDGRKATRLRNGIYRRYLAYLRVLRRLRNSPRPLQELPWFWINEKFNAGSLIDHGPCLYWYRAAEAEQLLRAVGFEICAVGSRRHVREGRMVRSAEALDGPLDALLYLVCRKPAEDGPGRGCRKSSGGVRT